MAELDYQYLYVLQKQTMDGDSDAYAELYAATYEQQYQFACYFTEDIYLAQDALKKLYIYARDNMDQLTDPLQFISWLDQINFYVCCQLLKDGKLSEVPDEVYQLPFQESRVIVMHDYLWISFLNISLATSESPRSLALLHRRARTLLEKKGIHPKAQKGHHRKGLSFPIKVDHKSADILLASVLNTCGCELNAVPISTISNYRIFRRESYALPKVITGITLFVLLLMPFLFVTPKATLHSYVDANTNRSVYNLEISSLLRVKSVSAFINEEALPVYETDEKVYTIEPAANGTASVTVTLENGQFTVVTFDV